jgi:mono/diheme cytochrome c family protein
MWSAVIAGAVGMIGLGAVAGDAVHGIDLGKQEYMSKCAVCHGESGVGAGDSTEVLTRKPGDLATLARRNGGYPTELVWLAIDGRTLDDSVQRHREMPVWGQDYRNEALANPEYRTPEVYVSQRVGALVDYVATLQVK